MRDHATLRPSLRTLVALSAWSLVPVLALGCTGSLEVPLPAPDQRAPVDQPSDGPASGATDDGSAAPPADRPTACSSASAQVGTSLLRRLSNLELQLTLEDLFQLPAPPNLSSLPPDNDREGFKTFAEVQPLSALHLRSYAAIASDLADALLADDARRLRVLGCETSDSTCLRSFVKSFGARAYRRPLEVVELDAVSQRATAQGLDEPDRFRFAIQTLLTSANFLYRVEIGDAPDGLSTLAPHELAARLSFTLWGRAPSAELMAAAQAGTLQTEEGLRKTARQMLADPRAAKFFAAFFRQWLGYDTMRAPVVPPSDWSDTLLVDMQGETDAVLAEHAFGSGSLLDALSTNRTRASPALARFYGLPAPQGDGLLTIPARSPRANAGILGHASLLSAKSDGDLIAIRGNWLRRTFFCRSLEIPSEIAADLGELLVGLTRVEIVQQRNREAACKGCHAKIDPIGVGLAKFDASGRFDESLDSAQFGLTPGLPDVDVPGFSSLAELASKLRAAPEVSDCLAEKVFVYLSGRDPAAEDRCTLQGAASNFTASQHGFAPLLSSLVESPSFRLRRAPSASQKAEE